MRKKRNILLVALIALCAAAFLGYRTLDRIRTDSRPPEITIAPAALEISVTDPTQALLAGITATDKTDGDVTDSLVVEHVSILDNTGRLSVSYAAFDKAGNVAKAQREARYTDYVPPHFTLNKPLLFRSGTTFDVLNVLGATDMIDGNIQHRIRATALSDSSITAAGIHDVQFQVTNSLGDTVSMVFPVEVYDPQDYNAELTLTNYLIYLDAGESFNASRYLKDFTCMGETTTLSTRLPYGFSLKTEGTVQTNTPGVYPVTYRVTYQDPSLTGADLIRTYVGYSKLIVVVEG